jgi:hypothetical protein
MWWFPLVVSNFSDKYPNQPQSCCDDSHEHITQEIPKPVALLMTAHVVVGAITHYDPFG